jgi:2-polyprenyl-3-methyl-5-hydroxy-6-metoxy-1,4-benzoquinol methylase
MLLIFKPVKYGEEVKIVLLTEEGYILNSESDITRSKRGNFKNLSKRWLCMVKQGIRTIFRHLGYEIKKIEISSCETFSGRKRTNFAVESLSADPVWPLPRRSNGLSDEKIRNEFAKYEWWHYAYAFEGGLSFPVRHARPDVLINAPDRHLQRFRHFMPYVIESQNGSLKGKRILDISCNSGFFSIQCALLGADVVGFDVRPELIEQANMIKSIVGIDNVKFTVLDFWDMNPRSLDGTFDVVLNLGILYHLSDPFEALQRTKVMARKNILLDTGVYRSENPVILLRWEEPVDIWTAYHAGIVTYPTKRCIDLILRHLEVAEWFEIPIRSGSIPQDYLEQRRASWLIRV